MPATTATPAEAAFDRLAARIARREEVPASEVLVILAAAGRTLAELQTAADIRAVHRPAIRT